MDHCKSPSHSIARRTDRCHRNHRVRHYLEMEMKYTKTKQGHDENDEECSLKLCCDVL